MDDNYISGGTLQVCPHSHELVIVTFLTIQKFLTYRNVLIIQNAPKVPVLSVVI